MCWQAATANGPYRLILSTTPHNRLPRHRSPNSQMHRMRTFQANGVSNVPEPKSAGAIRVLMRLRAPTWKFRTLRLQDTMQPLYRGMKRISRCSATRN